jgi:cell division septal protein FtsQ
MPLIAYIQNLFKRKRPPRRVEWLHANVPRSRSRPHYAQLILPAGVLALAALGAWLFYHFHFRRNSQFILRELVITSGETMNEMLVREYLGLREGMPLFDLDIERRRRELLTDAPNIRSASITRQIPSRMEVRIVEREPVGRMGRSGQVADDEGVVFPRYVGVDHLPMIVGVEGIEVQSGTRLAGMGLAAVRLLATIRRPEYNLPVAMVDLAHSDYLQLTLSDQRQVRLWWKGMDTAGVDSREALARRLRRLLQAMAAAPQRRVWDATVPDDNRIFTPY